MQTAPPLPVAETAVRESMPSHPEPLLVPCGVQTLFAWRHSPQQASDHAVVICPPLGHEQLHAHRSLRFLADALSRRGMTAIRFDWTGTGDSAGDARDVNAFETYLEDLRGILRWLKSEHSWRRVSVVGLRMGATLAAAALMSEPVDQLILWAPVVNGRGYVRELAALDRMSELQTRCPGSDAIEAAGFETSSRLAADFAHLSLLTAVPECSRILLTGRDDTPADSRIAAHLNAAGLTVDLDHAAGVTAMLDEPHKSVVPAESISRIVDWLAAQEVEPDSSTESREPGTGGPTLDFISGDTYRERAAWIRPGLFGVLCEPPGRLAVERPTIVLLNAGAACRTGPGRMTVELARALAAAGFRSLRIDATGLGDSLAGTGIPGNDSYPATVFQDIVDTMAWIRDSFQDHRTVLAGLCSGAYAAFQAAAQIDDPALVESLMINPLTYYWCDGMTLETATARDRIREQYYLASALDPAKWWKLLSGRSQIGVAGAFQVLWRRLRPRRTPDRGGDEDNSIRLGHPATENLPRDLLRVSDRGRQLAMFFAKSDPGYGILMAQAARVARGMSRSGRLTFEFFENADHTFSRRECRLRLIESVARHLQQRFPACSQ